MKILRFSICMCKYYKYVCSVDEIYHILSQNNMNNQNSETPNQNWRTQNFIDESRNHNVTRSDNFYGHYPTSQILNDYLHTGYVYPSVLPPYRTGEAPLPSSNGQIANPLTMLSPEDYSKYYNKMQNYMPPDPRLCIKNYPPHPSFYEHHSYRPPHFHGIGLQNQNSSHPSNLLIFPNQPYSSNQLSKINKQNKNKSIIVIESDEENNPSSSQTKKLFIQKKQDKLLIKQLELEEKRHANNQKIQQQKKQTMVRILPSLMVDSPIEQASHVYRNLQQKKQKHVGPNFDKFPIINEAIRQIIPIEVVNELRDQILQQLQIAELPDEMMKIFITYKTLETHSKYLEDQEISIKVFNLLRIYRAIIEFEKQRKYFIQHIVGDQILKRFNYAPKNKISANHDLISKQKIDIIARQINQSIHYNGKFNETKQFTSKQEINNNKQISNLNHPSKTKKIYKRQFPEQNSEEVSYNNKGKLIEKEALQPHPNIFCERKLRDRKKKKSKKQKYQKSYSQKYLKETQKEQKEKIQNSKTEKIQKKQGGKADLEFSQQDQGLIQKIEGWAERAVLAYGIQQKIKKGVKSSSLNQNLSKADPFKVLKKDEILSQTKKYKERSSKASQNQFRAMLNQKIQQQKTKQESKTQNLVTFITSNNKNEIEKEEYQRQLTHLTKELKNNENHGRIRIGKEYYQAKMPNFIQSQKQLSLLMKQKRQKLMERKMSVLTF